MPRLTNGTAVIECDDATAEKMPPGWRPVDEVDDLDDDPDTDPEGTDPAGEDPAGDDPEGDDLDGDDEADARTDWSIEQLRAFAAENEIDLGKTKTKDKILAIIEAAIAEDDDEDDDLADDSAE